MNHTYDEVKDAMPEHWFMNEETGEVIMIKAINHLYAARALSNHVGDWYKNAGFIRISKEELFESSVG